MNGLLCLGIVAVYRLARWLCSDRTKLIVFAAGGMARLRESTLRPSAMALPLSMPYRHSLVYATVVLVLGGALAAVKVLTRRLPCQILDESPSLIPQEAGDPSR